MRWISFAVACVVASFGLVTPVRAGVRQWDGDCAPDVDWDELCNGISTSNWDQDPDLPGSMDSVNIPSSAGQTRLGFHFFLQGATVPGGLLIDGGYFLNLHADSTIGNLSVSGGGVRALNGATVTLLGNTSLFGFLGGDGTTGNFQIVDQYFGGGVFEEGAQVTTLSTATVSSNMSMHHPPTRWFNQGNTTLSANISTSAADTADIVNQSNFTVVGGQQVDIRVDFINQGGTLEVQEPGTVLALKSHVSQFMGGTVRVLDGTTLKLQALGGEPQVHEFGNSPTLTGAGWIEVIGNSYDVTAPLTTGVGVGTADSGTGGFELKDATLFVGPDIDITNTARFSFVNGSIIGTGRFVNESEAYTASGSAIFGIEVLNKGTFSVLCCSIVIGGGMIFENQHDVLVHGDIVIQEDSFFRNLGDSFEPEHNGVVRLEASGARISGAGTFLNHGGKVRATVGAQEAVYISSSFWNGFPLSNIHSLGLVDARSGTLVFEGEVQNLDGQGVLVGGLWKGGSSATIDFPRGVTGVGDDATVRYTRVEFDRPQPDFESLGSVNRNAVAIFNGGQNFFGAVEIVNGGVLRGGNLTIDGIPTIRQGGRLTIDPVGVFFTPAETNVGDGSDSITPELAGGEPDPEGRPTARGQGSPPAESVMITSKLNNRGRVLPGSRRHTGTLEIQGDFEQYSMGHLHIETASGGIGDQLEIVGNAVLDGTLELGRIPGDAPETGLVYTILTTTGSLTGTFSEVDSIDTAQVIYNAHSVDVIFDEVDPAWVFSDDFESGNTLWWSTTVP